MSTPDRSHCYGKLVGLPEHCPGDDCRMTSCVDGPPSAAPDDVLAANAVTKLRSHAEEHDDDEIEALLAEYERRGARVAELEGCEARTEWGLRWPEPDGRVRFTGSEEQIKGPHTLHWREGGAEIVRREIREYVGQWTAVSP